MLDFVNQEWYVITAAILGIVPAIYFVFNRIYELVARFKVIFPDNNEEFYEHYVDAVKSAKKDIYITGDGFNMSNARSKRYASKVLNAKRTALQKKVKMIRIQNTETMHLNWIEELKKLKNEFPENFEIWINTAVKNIPNICTLDTNTYHSVSWRMEHILGEVPTQGSTPHTYCFTHNSREQARRDRQNLLVIINHPGARQLDESGLDDLYAKLFKERMDALQAWGDSQDGTLGNLAESGIFDEIVIGAFISNRNDNMVT